MHYIALFVDLVLPVPVRTRSYLIVASRPSALDGRLHFNEESTNIVITTEWAFQLAGQRERLPLLDKISTLCVGVPHRKLSRHCYGVRKWW